jgi:aminodeoxyfutalosine deaminase
LPKAQYIHKGKLKTKSALVKALVTRIHFAKHADQHKHSSILCAVFFTVVCGFEHLRGKRTNFAAQKERKMHNNTRMISADLVFPISSPPIEGGVLVCGPDGTLEDVLESKHRDKAGVEKYKGWLVPGFVNTHCHLELSHMKGRVDTGTGLISFITSVVTKRSSISKRVIDSAIRRADAEMHKNGIVAVGDISNQTDTFAVKQNSTIRYYTFLELFDFLQENGAEKAFSDWKPVYDAAPHADGNARSMVPHAPYSVSKSLFEKINAVNTEMNATVSIHNQETLDEEALFLDKSGGFPDFYGAFGMSLEHWKPTGQSAIRYAMQHLNPAQRNLFVHNTLTSAADITAAQAWSKHVYWATCPNANLYIENRLPNYQLFIDAGARMTIGTDSLTSNWQLSVLEEMKTIQRYQSYVSTELLLHWATLNGAQALGMDAQLGCFSVGKAPGVNLLSGFDKSARLGSAAQVRRLV